jgi:hypothetical protein
MQLPSLFVWIANHVDLMDVLSRAAAVVTDLIVRERDTKLANRSWFVSLERVKRGTSTRRACTHGYLSSMAPSVLQNALSVPCAFSNHQFDRSRHRASGTPGTVSRIALESTK